MPSQSRESAEAGAGRNHGAAMLDCNRRVLSVDYQLPDGPGFAAQLFEYVHMIGAGANDARSWAFQERGYECEGLIESRWRIEDSRVGHYSDEAG